MKKLSILLLALFVLSFVGQAQINLKRKGEKKANEVIDNLLFGKKKKNKGNGGTESPSSGGDSNTGGGEMDDYTPEEVDFGSLDYTKSISFRTLINMLPERTQGFSRDGKPEGARYSTQGVSYSTGIKNYLNNGREMTITLNDYLGAEFYATALTSQQYEYESTDGYAKSITVDGMAGWVNFEYDNGEGTLFLSLSERFYMTVQAEGSNEAELKAIASDVDLTRLQSKIGE